MSSAQEFAELLLPRETLGSIWWHPHAQPALWFLRVEEKWREQPWGFMEGWLKASWDGEKGIDKEIMRNEPATLAFFILRLISFLNVYVTSYFCHSRFTHVKTEAQTEWLGSSSMPGLDKGTTRPSLKVLEPSRIGREWRLKGSVLLGHGGLFLQGCVPIATGTQEAAFYARRSGCDPRGRSRCDGIHEFWLHGGVGRFWAVCKLSASLSTASSAAIAA